MSDGICRARLRASTATCVWLAMWGASFPAFAGDTGYVYDALGRVVQVSYPDGGQVSYVYDAAGNRTQVSTVATVSYCNSLSVGNNCFSPNQQYKLYMAPDGNLVLYTAANAVVWSTQTWNTNGNIAMVEADGNFVVKNATSGAIHWQTGTWGNQGANLSVTDTGDLRLTSSTGQILWARSHNSFVLGVGQKRTSFQNGSYFEMMTGGNLGVYNASGTLLWSTGLTGSAATAAKYYTDGNFALINTATGAPVWQTFTSGNPGAIFLYGDGGLVIADQWWSPVWSNNYGRVKVLRKGQSLKSANNAYTLTLQHDSNVVLKDANGVEKWASYSYSTDGNWLRFQEDGNLIFSGPNSGLIFASQTYGNYDATFEISNDGVIRVIKPSGQVLWAANESYYLPVGGNIKSANQQFELVMNGDGNVVLRYVGGATIWNTQTWSGASGTKFIDGELKVVNGSTTVWSSGTGGNPGATIEVANTGQVIIRSAAGATLWTSNTAVVTYMLTSGQSILSANGLYRLILQGDGNLVLYKTAGGVLWASNTYSGASGVLFEDGNLRVMNGTTATWQSNTGSNVGATLTVANTGQVIIKTATGTNLWVSNTAQNNLPVAANDTANTAHNTAVSINVLGNDSDIDQDALSVSAVGTTSNGTTSLGQGGVIYTPNNGFSGTDSFTYTLSDGRGGTATGTVTVTVAEAPNTPPVANTDTVSTAHNTAVTISPLSNDTDADSDPLSISAVGTPSHGTATSSGTNIIYTPTTGYSGTDSFSYTVSDGRGGTATGTVNVTVASGATIINVTSASNLRTLANNAGYTGSNAASYQFVVPSGTTILGSPGGGTAIETGTWPTGVTLSLVINGNVYGGGGNGGHADDSGPPGNGSIGGDAIKANAPISVTVNSGGSVKAGGGGGGAASPLAGTGQAGGGGGGFPNGYGGLGIYNGGMGLSGTTTGGGYGSGGGGAGGNAGLNGYEGREDISNGGSGGAAGYAIRKNGNAVNVTNNGTVTGVAN